MCIAILNKSNITISKKTLRRCWDNNRDGGGILYAQDGKLNVYKELSCFNDFYSSYVAIREANFDSDIVLHFRIATHGEVDETNCHPFIVNDDLGFVHNGIIDSVPYSKVYSDTYMFNENVLKKLPRNFLEEDGILNLISYFIDYSKLIFLDNKGVPTIINENYGVWDGGNWFSNSTYKPVNYKDYGGKKVYNNVGNSNIVSKPTYTDFDFDYGRYQDTTPYIKEEKNDWFGSHCECCDSFCNDRDLKFSNQYNIYMCKECFEYFEPKKHDVVCSV